MWTDEHREKYKYDDRRYPSDLTDTEWETIRPLFVGYETLTVDLREMVNACFYLQKTGCQWRYLPKDFGPWPTVRTWHDRFRADGIWAQAAALLTRAVRQHKGRAAEPSTGIVDSQSVVSGPQPGERGVDGNKKIKGIKRHVLTCSLGFALAVLVTAANVHDTKAAGLLLDRAAEDGWHLARLKVDGIYIGARMDAAAARHGLDVQVSSRDPQADGFTPLPVRWRIEATFGIQSNRYRRLTRNLEQDDAAAEDAFELANFQRLLRLYSREIAAAA
ncbi:IS5 family transposase [Azospirillum canadense]|uniref:IS5 family transposase n=1 Tax=Azospirillum canadense TaxID=403962 RepID=UPI002227546A|nr:IS5 family transposase [Azospirillum canadense]MCW2241346.1 putative transposase [Azospirillum canadense]